jgi:hypothetical protein
VQGPRGPKISVARSTIPAAFFIADASVVSGSNFVGGTSKPILVGTAGVLPFGPLRSQLRCRTHWPPGLLGPVRLFVGGLGAAWGG